MKWIIILGLLIMLALFIYTRYRRQIQTALQVWRMYKKMRQASTAPAEKTIEKKTTDTSQPLVRCARCGKWVAPNDALKLGKNTVYCSTACMEKSARLESLVDR